jgi:hypothetical protein
MDWRNQRIAPAANKTPDKVRIDFPCPGIFRFTGLVSFLIVGPGLFYGGAKLLGIPRLNWINPAWTTSHILLLAVSLLLGMLAGLIGAAWGMTIEVRSERTSDLLITLWQFAATTSMAWFMIIGVAMSISLGKDAAKAAVIHFGAERATLHVVATGVIVGLLQGLAFFTAPAFRIRFVPYAIFCMAVSLAAARWHYQSYGIAGRVWVGAGIVLPFVVLLWAPDLIKRDQKQRRQAMSEASMRR